MERSGLQTDPRLLRIVRIRKLLFSVQWCAALLISLALIMNEKATFSPLLLPLSSAVLVLMFMLLTIILEDIYFYVLAMKFGRRNNTRFLAARKFRRSSLFRLPFLALFILLVLAASYTNMLNVHGNVEGGTFSKASFSGSDPAVLYSAASLYIWNLGSGNLTFCVVPANIYFASISGGTAPNESFLASASINGANDVVPGGSSDHLMISTVPGNSYVIALFSSTGAVNAQYMIKMQLSPSLVISMYFALLAAGLSLFQFSRSSSTLLKLKQKSIYA